MIRVILTVMVVSGFFLGTGLALLERSLVLGAAMVASNALMLLNSLFFLVMDFGTRDRRGRGA